MIDINIKGVMYGIGAALPKMRERKTGHFINISSIAGHHVWPGGGIYSGTKFAVRAMSEALRQEEALARSNIRVTNVSPGAIETELVETISNSAAKARYTVRFVDMPWDEDLILGDAMVRMVQGEMAQVHEIWFRQYEYLYGSSVKDAIKTGQAIDLEKTKTKNGIDLWVTPAQGGVAPKDFTKTGWAGMTAIWSYAGLPTISIPLTKIGGMPLGFQYIGSHGNDEALLFWAKEIERALMPE